MYQTLYPIKDTTIDSQYPERNEGLDQVLTLRKVTQGEPSIIGEEDVFYDATFNSRVLIKFDLTTVSQSIHTGKISSDNYFYLTLKALDTINLPLEYTLYTYPVSGSWENGSGFNNSNPQIKNGVSWYYRDSKLSGTRWLTGSFNSGTTGSYGAIGGGGTWFTSSICSQSFSFEVPDIRMDVTSICRHWISGSIPNEGFILKLGNEVEFTSQSFGEILLYSVNSHTIFVPRLEVYWKDVDHSGTGSISEISDDDYVLYIKNLKDSYSQQERAKVRINVREPFPVQTYGTSSIYTNVKRLPVNSYFQIQDVVTDEVIIPFHPSGTMLNCDSNGNYFYADISSLMSERMYKFVFKSEHENGDIVKIVDDNFNFKVKRT